MVSGLVTSPWLQLRIFSGEAREMRIESKSAIKFARSYGEDLKIASNNSLKLSAISDQPLQTSFKLIADGSLNPPQAPYPASRELSSSTPHRDTTTAIPGSTR